MASAEDPPDPNQHGKWNFTFNPFKLLGVSGDPEPEEVRKAYKTLIRTSHPDKAVGKDGLAKKLTVAYNYLKNADAETLKKLAQNFGNAPGAPSQGRSHGQDEDLSHVLVDKTKAEHYRRLFEANLQLATESHFKDNFQQVYKQIFDNVSTQPSENVGYRCELCEEDFICEEDHFDLVYSPYSEYVLDQADQGLWKYLESIVGKETVSWTSPITNVGSWSLDAFGKALATWCNKLERSDVGSDEFSSCREISQALFSARDKSVEELVTDVLPLLPAPKQIETLVDAELIIPAFLKVIKNFQDWSPLSFKLCNQSPRLAVILACAGASLEPNKEDNFLKLGENLVKLQLQGGFGYAHLCFILGSCDLNTVAHKLFSLTSHIEGKRLSAHYLLKTNDLASLDSRAKSAMTSRDIDTAAVYVTPLVNHYLQIRDGDGVVSALRIMLSGNRLWRAVQELVLDDPDLLYCQAVALATMEHVLQQINCRVPNFNAILAACGALHICHGVENNLIRVFMTVIRRQLDSRLIEGDAAFILGLARIPGILPVIKATLQHKLFIGANAVKGRPGSSFYACLLVLRALYHYKSQRYTPMGHDFATAAMFTLDNGILDAIATFVAANPMINEKMMKVASAQFQQLETYIEENTGELVVDTNFAEILNKAAANEEPFLSSGYSSAGGRTGPDLKALENDILNGQADAENDGDEDDDDDQVVGARARPSRLLTETELRERALNFVNLEVICGGTYETICCLTMAAQYFLKAMLATSDTDIPKKFAYRSLLLECASQINLYANMFQLPTHTALHALRTHLSFVFRANQHFSEILRKNNKCNGDVKFIDEDEVPTQTQRWQMLLNMRSLCPIVLPDIYTIAEGKFALVFIQRLCHSLLKAKIACGLYSNNTPAVHYHHALFNEVWGQRIDPEDTGYEEDIPQISLLDAQLEVINEENDSLEEKERKRKHNESIETQKRELQEQRRELEQLPLVDRVGFKLSRENSMLLLSALFGYDMEDVETMMKWEKIRRTSDGFIDMSQRTLNFDGDQAYSRFLGVSMNPNTKTFNLILEPAVPGDPNRPALFSSVDLLEIFGNKILAGVLSFDEELLPENLSDHTRLMVPFHPFYKVRFAGISPQRHGKEVICGTNFLMTLYHLDLLAKVFTTGQEVSANFPFDFRSTEAHLLSGLSRELQNILKPIGPRKKVKNLRPLELIHRFWFEINEVEQEIIQGSQQNGGASTIKYGNADVVLKTMHMMRGKDGQLQDAEHLFDPESPEAKFVRGFNEKLHLIEKEFPIIQRIKELAKISQCFGVLHSNKESLEKDLPTFKALMQIQLPATRPYSKCTGGANGCHCCDWVPAVYHHMKVTDEQKLEYLFEKFSLGTPENALDEGERIRRLLFHRGQGQDNNAEASSSSTSHTSQAGSSNGSPSVDLGKYDRLEVYRCYGGVSFQPNGKTVQGIPRSPNESWVTWENALNVALFAAQFIPAARVASIFGKVGLAALRVLRGGACLGGRGGGGGKVGKLTSVSPSVNTTNKHRLDYVGPTWMYAIRPKGGKITECKIGITSNGPNAKGELLRPLRQVQKLNREAKKAGKDIEYEYIVRRQVFGSKLEARAKESDLINFMRGKNPEHFGIEKGAHPSYTEISK